MSGPCRQFLTACGSSIVRSLEVWTGTPARRAPDEFEADRDRGRARKRNNIRRRLPRGGGPRRRYRKRQCAFRTQHRKVGRLRTGDRVNVTRCAPSRRWCHVQSRRARRPLSGCPGRRAPAAKYLLAGAASLPPIRQPPSRLQRQANPDQLSRVWWPLTSPPDRPRELRSDRCHVQEPPWDGVAGKPLCPAATSLVPAATPGIRQLPASWTCMYLAPCRWQLLRPRPFRRPGCVPWRSQAHGKQDMSRSPVPVPISRRPSRIERGSLVLCAQPMRSAPSS